MPHSLLLFIMINSGAIQLSGLASKVIVPLPDLQSRKVRVYRHAYLASKDEIIALKWLNHCLHISYLFLNVRLYQPRHRLARRR